MGWNLRDELVLLSTQEERWRVLDQWYRGLAGPNLVTEPGQILYRRESLRNERPHRTEGVLKDQPRDLALILDCQLNRERTAE